MGIISKIKSLLRKDVILDFDISSFLLYVYKLKRGEIRLQTKLVVPNGFVFVIAKNGKVYDIFNEGEYVFSLSNLPKCVKKFKLDKADKYGKLPKTFEADAYFVNLKLFEYSKWKSYRKISLFDKNLGWFSIKLEGGFAFKVVDSFRFVSNLLKIYDYLKNNEAESILESFLSEFVVNEVEKKNYDFNISLSKDALTDAIYDNLCDRMTSYGIEICGFIIEKIKIPKKIKKYLKDVQTQQTKQKVVDTDQKKEYDIDSCENVHNLRSSEQNNVCEQKIRCLLCGYENNVSNERCAICNEKLRRRN